MRCLKFRFTIQFEVTTSWTLPQALDTWKEACEQALHRVRALLFRDLFPYSPKRRACLQTIWKGKNFTGWNKMKGQRNLSFRTLKGLKGLGDEFMAVNTGWFPLTRFWLRTFTHVNFNHANNAEARYRALRLIVKLSEVQLLRLRATVHALRLFYLQT